MGPLPSPFPSLIAPLSFIHIGTLTARRVLPPSAFLSAAGFSASEGRDAHSRTNLLSNRNAREVCGREDRDAGTDLSGRRGDGGASRTSSENAISNESRGRLGGVRGRERRKRWWKVGYHLSDSGDFASSLYTFQRDSNLPLSECQT